KAVADSTERILRSHESHAASGWHNYHHLIEYGEARKNEGRSEQPVAEKNDDDDRRVRAKAGRPVGPIALPRQPIGQQASPRRARGGRYWRGARSFESSPDADISRTMPQPPMNLPFTNTCGIVGQLVNCLIPSRTAGLASTFTASNGWPSDFNTSMVAAEKPHI